MNDASGRFNRTGCGTLISAVALASSALTMTCVCAQSAADMNASNNPLTPSIGANLQDSYIGRYYGLGDKDSNAALLRGTLPHKLFGLPQILRATLPVVTTPQRGTQRTADRPR